MARLVTVSVLMACTAVPGVSRAQISSTAPDRPLVTAVGRGEVHLVPDHAFIMISVETRDSSARTAAACVPTFVARNTMRLSVGAISSVGRVLDAALSGGATQIGQVQFRSSHIDEAHRAALTQAVEHARADGETTARALGGALGGLVEVTTQGAPLPGIPYYGAMVAGGVASPVMSSAVVPTSLAGGDVVVSEAVGVRWRLVPKP